MEPNFRSLGDETNQWQKVAIAQKRSSCEDHYTAMNSQMEQREAATAS